MRLLRRALTKTMQQMMGFRQKAHSILFDPISGFIDFNDRRKITITASLQSAFLNLLSSQRALNLRRFIVVESIRLHKEEGEAHLSQHKSTADRSLQIMCKQNRFDGISLPSESIVPSLDAQCSCDHHDFPTLSRLQLVRSVHQFHRLLKDRHFEYRMIMSSIVSHF
jgi:hypothetical protein